MTIRELPAEALERLEKDAHPAEALLAYLNDQNASAAAWADLYDHFEQTYQGKWESLEHYADELAHQTGLCTCEQRSGGCYLDTEQFAYDLDKSGYWTAPAVDEWVHVFGE